MNFARYPTLLRCGAMLWGKRWRLTCLASQYGFVMPGPSCRFSGDWIQDHPAVRDERHEEA
jgi:hypothetical protein